MKRVNLLILAIIMTRNFEGEGTFYLSIVLVILLNSLKKDYLKDEMRNFID